MALQLTDANFDEMVLKAEKPVIVDLWAEWCGPCRVLSPILEGILADYSDSLDIVKINTDDEIATAIDYGIQSIPTMILFIDGKETMRMTGAKNRPALLHELEKVITLSK